MGVYLFANLAILRSVLTKSALFLEYLFQTTCLSGMAH